MSSAYDENEPPDLYEEESVVTMTPDEKKVWAASIYNRFYSGQRVLQSDIEQACKIKEWEPVLEFADELKPTADELQRLEDGPNSDRTAGLPKSEVEDMANRFSYHPPSSDEKIAKHQTIRNEGMEFALLLLQNVPPGRERSLAITHLEEVVMWANAGIARKV